MNLLSTQFFHFHLFALLMFQNSFLLFYIEDFLMFKKLYKPISYILYLSLMYWTLLTTCYYYKTLKGLMFHHTLNKIKWILEYLVILKWWQCILKNCLFILYNIYVLKISWQVRLHVWQKKWHLKTFCLKQLSKNVLSPVKRKKVHSNRKCSS